MRLFILGVALLFTTTAASAQTRWTLSAGPEWWTAVGGRVRGEYDLIKPDRPVRVRFELGGYWEPTQNYFGTFSIKENGSYMGSRQAVDFAFGVTASLTPLPRARFAPYVSIGVLARQMWVHGWNSITTPDTNTQVTYSGTQGQMIVPYGLGVRARLGARLFQVEMRRVEHRTALLVGTSLPF
jgi:hypothetical protein